MNALFSAHRSSSAALKPPPKYGRNEPLTSVTLSSDDQEVPAALDKDGRLPVLPRADKAKKAASGRKDVVKVKRTEPSHRD